MEFLKKLFVGFTLVLITITIISYSYLQIISREQTIEIFERIGSNRLIYRKIVGHLSVNIGLSFLITIFLYLIDIHSKKIIIINSLGGLFLSIIFELLQLFGKGRFFSFQDILINYCGYMIISMIVLGCRVILLK